MITNILYFYRMNGVEFFQVFYNGLHPLYYMLNELKVINKYLSSSSNTPDTTDAVKKLFCVSPESSEDDFRTLLKQRQLFAAGVVLGCVPELVTKNKQDSELVRKNMEEHIKQVANLVRFGMFEDVRNYVEVLISQ